jgi:phage-related protein
LVKNLGDKLWEVRSAIPNGIARVIFIVSDGKMILLHGFIKKAQKAPLQDLQLAKERAKNYEGENGQEK